MRFLRPFLIRRQASDAGVVVGRRLVSHLDSVTPQRSGDILGDGGAVHRGDADIAFRIRVRGDRRADVPLEACRRREHPRSIRHLNPYFVFARADGNFVRDVAGNHVVDRAGDDGVGGIPAGCLDVIDLEGVHIVVGVARAAALALASALELAPHALSDSSSLVGSPPFISGPGILKNTTGTGVPSIAVAADFPILNQNTTGTAGSTATLATARTISTNGDE